MMEWRDTYLGLVETQGVDAYGRLLPEKLLSLPLSLLWGQQDQKRREENAPAMDVPSPFEYMNQGFPCRRPHGAHEGLSVQVPTVLCLRRSFHYPSYSLCQKSIHARHLERNSLDWLTW